MFWKKSEKKTINYHAAVLVYVNEDGSLTLTAVHHAPNSKNQLIKNAHLYIDLALKAFNSEVKELRAILKKEAQEEVGA